MSVGMRASYNVSIQMDAENSTAMRIEAKRIT